MTVPAELLKQVKGIALRTRGVVDSLFSGEFRSVFRGQGMEFAEVRAYEQGDDFRAIDWNVSARLGSPYVKTFTEERELTLLLVVDQSASTRVGTPITKAARSVEVAAVLALAGAREQDRVGGLLFSDRIEHVVRPGKGRRHALRLIRDLLAFQGTRRGTNLTSAIHFASRVLGHRGVVVILSDFLAEGWERALRELAVRHEVIAITMDDPREEDPPRAGWVEMEDAETGRHALVNTESAAALRRWRAAVHARRVQRAERLLGAGVEHIALTAASDYGLVLRRAFARRLRRRRTRPR
ncbi:MAG TPA: DUF58 domain-containing protein [Gemmatimonadales bacterium]|jgi:uncharacterized protein (DUF58 family)|nr:DUF58 domain-containing protein [Gemmatimonadales bacterium]